MPSRFSSGKFSIAECDRCGFRFKLTKLKTLTIKTKNVNIRVCPECWEKDHPQLQLGLYPVNDPQAVRNPRPDLSYPQSRAYTEVLLNGAGVSMFLGTITTNGLPIISYTEVIATGPLLVLGTTAPTPYEVSGAASYFSGGMYAGGMYSGGFFNNTGGTPTPPPPTGVGYFRGGMFDGGMYTGGFF
jgi:hypothetical protein